MSPKKVCETPGPEELRYDCVRRRGLHSSDQTKARPLGALVQPDWCLHERAMRPQTHVCRHRGGQLSQAQERGRGRTSCPRVGPSSRHVSRPVCHIPGDNPAHGAHGYGSCLCEFNWQSYFWAPHTPWRSPSAPTADASRAPSSALGPLPALPVADPARVWGQGSHLDPLPAANHAKSRQP